MEDQSDKESSTLKCPISNGTSKNEQKEEIVSGNTKGKVDWNQAFIYTAFYPSKKF